nr:S-4TM family putative pore-forming effector [Methylobacterium sp. OTU13CASTA1]
MGAPVLNAIPELQNTEPLLRLLRARSQVYRVAVRFQTAQLAMTVVLPIVGATASLWLPDWRTTITVGVLILAAMDAFWVDRAMKRRLKDAAKISEQFDCELLDMRWNGFVAGNRVDPQVVGSAALSWTKGDAKLVNWYSRAVEQVDHDEARLICQRANLDYDGGLRRFYGKVLIYFLAFVFVSISTAFYLLGLGRNEMLAGIVLPLAPLIVWSVREFFRQKDAAQGIEQVRDAADALFDKILGGEVPAGDFKARSREFQDAILLRRSQNPLIAPLMYRLLRKRMETNMGVATDEIIRRLRQRRQDVCRLADSTAS